VKMHHLHFFAIRAAHNHKEVFILAGDEAEAERIYNKLMPSTASKFNASLGGWAYADLREAPPPSSGADKGRGT
jgi:hypothetical protein